MNTFTVLNGVKLQSKLTTDDGGVKINLTPLLSADAAFNLNILKLVFLAEKIYLYVWKALSMAYQMAY